MQRQHALEFEDFDWFPSWLRTCMTNVIVIVARGIGVVDALTNLVVPLAKERGIKRIVDMGSGAGGSFPEVVEKVRATEGCEGVELLLSDLYPNLDAMEKFNAEEKPHVRYSREPVDATHLDQAPEGLKTMVNCFHHMKPDMAKTILKSAHDNRQPLLIFEMGENFQPTILSYLIFPFFYPIVFVMVFFLTPLVRPLTFRQIFFTYLVPIIPVFYAWDGLMSVPRIYTFKDLETLTADLQDPGYTWKMGHGTKANGKKLGVYLLGMPTP
jgi:hypothetical protein